MPGFRPVISHCRKISAITISISRHINGCSTSVITAIDAERFSEEWRVATKPARPSGGKNARLIESHNSEFSFAFLQILIRKRPLFFHD
jgi:hypothetical protein